MIEYAEAGIASLTADAVDSVTDFLLSQQNQDGGFAGRNGKSDLYYTVFGIQLIHALKLIPSESLKSYITSFGNPALLDFVHSVSLLRCLAMLQIGSSALIERLFLQVEAYRTSDGGYNHTAKHMETGTVYANYLAHLAYRESDTEMPQAHLLLHCVMKLQKIDGSFANDSETALGSTGATAAAFILLKLLGQYIDDRMVEALVSRSYPGNGFKPYLSSPIPDLLSTATALFALKSTELDFKIPQDCMDHREFITSLWNADGGFSGNILDDVSDCEYTFYALLALGVQ